MDEKELKKTLNLPQTKFPMKANLSQREPETMKLWDSLDLYANLRRSKKGKPRFLLHDGPPYANGKIHLGHVVNKVLKDLMVKSKSMMGYDSPYVPGWDCHGLPIELQVEKHTSAKKKDMDPVNFRRECRKYAEKYLDIQRDQFKRLGIFGDWENPYMTMAPSYQATIARIYGEFYRSGHVYRGFKPVHWCWSCETALADTEVEYQDHRSPSIYVKFPVEADWSSLDPALKGKKIFVLIWTTTPWTLPANLAIAFHPDFDYVAYELPDGETYIFAEKLLANLTQIARLPEGRIIAKISGGRFEGRKARHPFLDRDSILIVADHVTMDQGTGTVHTAPGHGADDYYSGVKYGLEILNPVDDKGRFYPDVKFFGGQFVFDANPKIVQHLKENGMLLYSEKYDHSYPHCPRCHNPILFRATEQWFVSMKGLKDKALEEIKKVKWEPAWGEERMYNMIDTRPDWTISRQRVWGVPITAFYCGECKELLQDPRIFDFVADIYEKEGADAWYIRDAKDLLPPDVECQNCGHTTFQKGFDILDVWFDSGCSHEAVMSVRKDLWWPSDVYLEGNDQYRGWFNSSLMTAIKTRGRSPYQICVTHGMVVDAKGHKMSKSLGNYIDPEEIVKKSGSEILRAWVSMVDYHEEISIGHETLERVAEAYRKIRNTFRYLLSNLYDFQPDYQEVEEQNLEPLDRWALQCLSELTEKVLKAYERFEYHIVYHSLYRFCVVDMSAFYLDINKDRLYVSLASSTKRRAAQTTMFKILNQLVRLTAPILSFTSEEVWQEMPAFKDKAKTVHLTEFETTVRDWLTEEEKKEWEKLAEYRDAVLKLLEEARQRKEIGSSLEAEVICQFAEEEKPIVEKYENFLAELFIVSRVRVNFGTETRFEVRRSEGEKCQRCWQIKMDVGANPAYPNVCGRCAEVLDQLQVGHA
ncbi:isoleucine--tRNA ligase [bacterium]|nr:isoleucine--tRNA ligase [bacterium]